MGVHRVRRGRVPRARVRRRNRARSYLRPRRRVVEGSRENALQPQRSSRLGRTATDGAERWPRGTRKLPDSVQNPAAPPWTRSEATFVIRVDATTYARKSR